MEAPRKSQSGAADPVCPIEPPNARGIQLCWPIMGNRHSAPGHPGDAPQDTVSYNGVRITESLARRIALQQAGGDGLVTALAPVHPSVTSDIRAAAALASHVDRDVQVAAEKMIAKSKALSKALETSRHVNDLLLAREEEELEKIDKLSREILEKEAEKYNLDTEKKEEKPCGEEEALLLRCYLEHAEDPLCCRQAAHLYTSCAFSAQK